MTAYRKMPDIGKPHTRASPSKSDDDLMGCVWTPVLIVILYFVLSAILRVTSNSGSKLDQIICYGALIYFVIMMLLGAREAYQKSKAREAERKMWAKSCETALLTIVSRHEATSWWDDSASRYHYTRNSLELEMNTNQKAVSPNQTIISAEVSQNVYTRLKECNTVRIYYMTESPMTFLLEEEL